MLIEYNGPESKIHAINIGNIDYNQLANPGLMAEIIEGGYDMVKAHSHAPYHDIISLLNKLNIPYVIHYQSLYLELDMEKYDGFGLDTGADFDFEFKAASYSAETVKFVRESIDVLKKYYADAPLVSTFYNADKILDLQAEYIAGFDYDKNSAAVHIGYDAEGTPIAFGAFKFEPGNTAMGYSGGAYPVLRNKKLGYLIHKKIFETIMIPLGIKKYYSEINILNTPSMLAAQLKGHGFAPKGYSTRLLLFPMAGKIKQSESCPVPKNFTKLYNNTTGAYTTGKCYKLIDGGYSLHAQEVLNTGGEVVHYNYYEAYGQ